MKCPETTRFATQTQTVASNIVTGLLTRFRATWDVEVPALLTFCFQNPSWSAMWWRSLHTKHDFFDMHSAVLWFSRQLMQSLLLLTCSFAGLPLKPSQNIRKWFFWQNVQRATLALFLPVSFFWAMWLLIALFPDLLEIASDLDSFAIDRLSSVWRKLSLQKSFQFVVWRWLGAIINMFVPQVSCT